MLGITRRAGPLKEFDKLRVRGRVHVVIGVRGSFLSSDSVESMAEERTCRVGVTNLHAVA